MKAFAAACMAASATAFDAIAVPDFVAGMIFGLTGDNHLTELEACYQGGSKVVTDSQVAVADFKAGQYFKGIQQAGVIWNEVGSAMTTCKGMDEDIAKIEAWAKIFTEPATLSKTVAKRWLFHGKEIRADIAKEETDWAAGSYFDAGKDVADALTLAVGPASSTEASNLSVKAPVEFLAGMLEGLLEENHLEEISLCVTDGEQLVDHVEELVKDVEAKHMIRAAKMAKTIKDELPTMLGACKSMGPEIKALESWATVFEHPKTISEDIAKSMLFHRKQIMGDISAIKADWSAAEYYKAGQATADILYTAVGPVQKPAYTYKMDLLAVPEVAAGFVYGMVGENNLTEMEACYASTSPLFTYLESALTSIESFHIVAALKDLEEFVYHFQLDVAPCTKMGDDIAAIEKWAAIFKSPSSLVSKATKHYLTHRKQIKQDIADIKADWAAKQYFGTGKVAADLLTTLVGPIEE
mmetsp:Transcript_19634/g.26542  ORF Transcript_19634/g.26542 Transcript_19634/m.26542 type:complete len:468 (-) Transcript_19634:212-1615(-)